jgi:hypothetical protein
MSLHVNRNKLARISSRYYTILVCLGYKVLCYLYVFSYLRLTELPAISSDFGDPPKKLGCPLLDNGPS